MWLGLTRRAISAMSLVPQFSLSANVAASFSLPNRKSTKGRASMRVFLKGGTCAHTRGGGGGAGGRHMHTHFAAGFRAGMQFFA